MENFYLTELSPVILRLDVTDFLQDDEDGTYPDYLPKTNSNGEIMCTAYQEMVPAQTFQI